MQKFIKIESQGIIDAKAFTLIGASTKRDDSSKIGFFGSGLKYSLAFLLRNNIPFKVFAEYREIEFGLKSETFRDKDFSLITIDGKETNMTTEMGIDWKSWFVIREIYCNAIDEGDVSMSIVNENNLNPVEGKSVFFIAVTPEISEVVENWDMYFSRDRKNVLYEGAKGSKFFSGGSELIVYRKGIRCLHVKETKCIFHYDLPWITINESRVISNEWEFKYLLRDQLKKNTDTKIIAQILNCIIGSWEAQLSWDSGIIEYSDQWCEVIGQKTLVPYENAGFWAEIIKENPTRYLILPGTMIEGLKKTFAERISVAGDCGEVEGSGDFMVRETLSRRDQCLLNDTIDWLKNAEYDIKYPIKVVSFAKPNRFGQAKNGTILLSEKLFEEGKRKLAAVIIEEQEHLITDFDDETRAFQNHFINKYVSALEDKTGKYL